MKFLLKELFVYCGFLLLSGCTVLHHAQIGNIYQGKGKKIELAVNEFGINLENTAKVAKAIGGDRSRSKKSDNFFKYLQFFYMGPKTGDIVFNDDFPDTLLNDLKLACPNGIISELLSLRETADYYMVSGEYVRIKGKCIEVKPIALPEIKKTETKK